MLLVKRARWWVIVGPLGSFTMDDGNVVIYPATGTALWKTDTSTPTGPAPQGNDLQPGEVLAPNQWIRSTSGQYELIYQGDGNLVL